MKINVIGAGFAGLTIARELCKKGFDVEIFERGDRPGGLISTQQTPDGLVETAAPSFTRTKAIEKLFEELGIQIVEPAKESKRRLFYIGRLTSWPLTIGESLKAATKAGFSKLTGKMAPIIGETVGMWGRRVLTDAALKKLVGAGLQGIYAGDVEKMSADLILGQMFNTNREKFRGVIGVDGGSYSVIQALTEDLKKSSVEIHYNADLTNIPKPCVIATSATAAGKLLSEEFPENARKISAIKMLPLISVTVFYKKATGPQAFGCLVPRNQGVRALGILLNYAIFPNRDIRPSETWIFGGATDPDFLQLNDSQIAEIIQHERQIIFKNSDKPISMTIIRWNEALPHYDLVLESILPDLKGMKNVWLHGNWLGGIGLSKILDRSQKLAAQIARELA